MGHHLAPLGSGNSASVWLLMVRDSAWLLYGQVTGIQPGSSRVREHGFSLAPLGS